MSIISFLSVLVMFSSFYRRFLFVFFGLVRARRTGFKECNDAMCALEGQLEHLLGALHVQMKGPFHLFLFCFVLFHEARSVRSSRRPFFISRFGPFLFLLFLLLLLLLLLLLFYSNVSGPLDNGR